MFKRQQANLPWLLSLYIYFIGGCVASFAFASETVAVDPPYQNAALAPKARALDLVTRMTLQEKASQLQNNSPAIARLGVPTYNWWNEGLHGVARAGNATVFPQSIGMAATWDPELISRVGDVVSTEFRAKFLEAVGADGGSSIYRGLTVWSPNVNIFRDPRWGRGQETFGEDPLLTSALGVAYIKGLQGEDSNNPKVIATVKHFAVHSGPESRRHSEDVHVDKRDLIETYLPAFYAAVTEAKVQSLMCAYNAVDGLPSCASSPLLTKKLRESWGFKGFVVSDCGAIADIYTPHAHGLVKTPEQAVAVAIKAGTDLICDFGDQGTADPKTTVRAVNSGLLSESELDTALVRLFEARFKLGLLNSPNNRPFKEISAKDYDTPEHRALAKKVAEESLVLLKNNGLLPLKTAPSRIAVIGPNAHSVEALVGNYSGTPTKPITVLDGLKARFPQAEINYVPGTGWVSPALQEIPRENLCQDKECTRKGLLFAQFDNLELRGSAKESQVDEAKFSWGWPDAFERKSSSRWTGYIRANESGIYNFRIKGQPGYKIYIDGKLVVDMWDIAWPTSKTEITLSQNKLYKLVVEAKQLGYSGEQLLQWSRPSGDAEAAIAAAKNADLVVFVGGLTAELEGEEMSVQVPGFAGGDRTSLDLPAAQETLLEKLQSTQKPIIFVLMSGSAVSVNWADQHLPAIIQAWYPGGDGGTAIAGLIAGDFSPSGRLPITIYKSADQLPDFDNYSMQGRTYKYFTGDALYPFGYGLSFTQFSYQNAKLSQKRIAAGEGVELSVNVKNTGTRAGSEVVQVYLKLPGKNAPLRSLIGFQRIFLAPNETREVSFKLDAKALSLVNASGERIVPSGSALLWVGGQQPKSAGLGSNKNAVLLVKLKIDGKKTISQF